MVLYLGAPAWVALAGLGSSSATAAALVLVAGAALLAMWVAIREDGPSRGHVLTRTTLGLYAGWVTAALFLNLATALVEAGAFGADAVGPQVVVLVLAVLALLVVTIAVRGLLAYAAGWEDDTTEVVVAAGAGAVAITVACVLAGPVRRRDATR